jgi:tripartite-type tricarboxylate transporter receptor subunit TctC
LQVRKTLIKVLAGFLALPLIAGCGALGGAGGTTDFPTKQVTYMIPFAPGGQSDREARRQQPLLEKALGQKVVIDYKEGAGGALGWTELARAKADGYLVGGFNLPHIVLQPIQNKTGYATDDLLPVAIFQRTILGLAVKKDSPYKTLDELLKAAKDKPGTISTGGSGTFSGPHFANTRLEQLAGVKFNYVPFNGAAPAQTAFLGGHIVGWWANSDELVKQKDNIRLLGFADEKRFAHFPDAPTFKENKIELVEAVDRGVAVPKGTPAAVVKKLEETFLKIAKDQAVIDAQLKEGFVPVAFNSAESQKHIKELVDRYTKLLAEMKK